MSCPARSGKYCNLHILCQPLSLHLQIQWQLRSDAIAFVNEISLQWQSQKQLLPQFVKATRIQLRIQLRLRIQLINVLVHNITIRFDILSLHIPTSHR
jgi:hypothetical protein